MDGVSAQRTKRRCCLLPRATARDSASHAGRQSGSRPGGLLGDGSAAGGGGRIRPANGWSAVPSGLGRCCCRETRLKTRGSSLPGWLPVRPPGGRSMDRSSGPSRRRRDRPTPSFVRPARVFRAAGAHPSLGGVARRRTSVVPTNTLQPKESLKESNRTKVLCPLQPLDWYESRLLTIRCVHLALRSVQVRDQRPLRWRTTSVVATSAAIGGNAKAASVAPPFSDGNGKVLALAEGAFRPSLSRDRRSGSSIPAPTTRT